MNKKTAWTRSAALVAVAMLASVAAPAAAVEYGLGTSYVSESTDLGSTRSLLFPIRTPTLMIEPELAISNSKVDGGGVSSKSDIYSVGSGLYAYRAMAPQFEAYAGARLLISKIKVDNGSTHVDGDAWTVAPTLGVQYFFAKQFSLGLDGALRYDHSKTKSSFGTTESTLTAKTWSTEARILLRGYF